MTACGTYAGYQAHRRHGTPKCGPCMDANAEYTRNRRLNSDIRLADLNQSRAYTRAMVRLRLAHPREFARLYAEEKGAR